MTKAWAWCNASSRSSEPCFLWIFVGALYVEALRGNKALAGALFAISAAVVGVILNLLIWFALHTLFRKSVPVRKWVLSFDAPIHQCGPCRIGTFHSCGCRDLPVQDRDASDCCRVICRENGPQVRQCFLGRHVHAERGAAWCDDGDRSWRADVRHAALHWLSQSTAARYGTTGSSQRARSQPCSSIFLHCNVLSCCRFSSCAVETKRIRATDA